MFIKQLFLIFVISYSAVFFLTPWFIKIAQRHKILDKPDKRKIHTKPLPTLGGIVLYLAFNFALIIALRINPQFRADFQAYMPGVFLGGFLIIILGIFHDTIDIRPEVKFLGQIIVALVLFNAGVRIESITNPFGGEIKLILPVSMFISVVWTLVMVNAVNLIDGLDGLAAGLTIISSLSLLAIAILKYDIGSIFIIIALIGSTLGFLRYNFHPAKIFMGDCGSMFLGFILSVVSIQGINKMAVTAALLIPITALGVPIYDVILSVLRRVVKRVGIFQADRKHIHYRLLDMGITHRHVVLVLYFMGIYFAIISYLFVLIPVEYAFILLILLGMGVFSGMQAIAFLEQRLKLLHKMKSKE
ncbi:MAG: MraY family glycosyltransferase [Candidatus Omnitrophota bacterium]|nr:MraY family glycosyltransferase [Candidatus Omnitrophota bacterium]